MEDSNRSSNHNIHDLSEPSRRTLLRGGLGATIGSPLAPLAGTAALTGCAATAGDDPLLGFKSLPVSSADTVVVPEGYSVQVIAAWGDPAGLSGESAPLKWDASNSAAEQEAQLGMRQRHHAVGHVPDLRRELHHLLQRRRHADAARRSGGTTSYSPATRPTAAPRPRATWRAIPSAAPTACGPTSAACCGSRPT